MRTTTEIPSRGSGDGCQDCVSQVGVESSEAFLACGCRGWQAAVAGLLAEARLCSRHRRGTELPQDAFTPAGRSGAA